MILGLFSHEVVTHDGTELFAYTPMSMVAVVLGAMLFAGSLVLIVLNTSPPGLITKIRSEGDSDKPEHHFDAEYVEEGVSQESTPEATKSLDLELVLHLLSGNERTIFRTLVDGGGAMYQKDLVNKTGMSDSKVSRVLDHLEAKDLITRERHGMSNRIAIKASK
ncbi:MAG: MarR family transcriptional regulator [Methanomassiliicoccales archaeon]|nr:MarR family transcriptional regulator [Methanomassiliicoccales archaeon]